MCPQGKWLLTGTLILLIAAPALGQLYLEMDPFLEDGLRGSVLLRNKGVLKEIHLTEKQKEKIEKIVRDAHRKYLPDTLKDINAGKKNLLQVIAEYNRKTALEAEENVRKILPEILKEEQIKRYKQIELQVNVVQSLNEPDKQKEFKFTENQKKDIKKIKEDFKHDFEKMMKAALADAARWDASEKRSKAGEMIQNTMKMWGEANRKALNVLNNEQKKKWKEMTGKRFDYKHDPYKFPDSPPSKQKVTSEPAPVHPQPPAASPPPRPIGRISSTTPGTTTISAHSNPNSVNAPKFRPTYATRRRNPTPRRAKG